MNDFITFRRAASWIDPAASLWPGPDSHFPSQHAAGVQPALRLCLCRSCPRFNRFQIHYYKPLLHFKGSSAAFTESQSKLLQTEFLLK